MVSDKRSATVTFGPGRLTFRLSVCRKARILKSRIRAFRQAESRKVSLPGPKVTVANSTDSTCITPNISVLPLTGELFSCNIIKIA